ncbi:hypothetical protein SteCoe_15495 [Stentor coeruleus]|uniref:Uncharacterized protein n=1 Tax=Stentor coeruleus TaxID=5963 RepID=A0A1R2C3D4_9CILI|nr:hypothetical protein SteCoe_15495 [Stentor coeruleus]
MDYNCLSSSSTSKSYKIIRVKKRVRNLNCYKIEDDLALEKQEKFTQFFENPTEVAQSLSPVFDKFGKLNPRSIIGPQSLFATKEQGKIFRRPSVTKRYSFKSPGPKKKIEDVIDYQSRFTEALSKIESAKINSSQNENEIYTSLSPREQKIMKRQTDVLQNFVKTQRYWKELEKGLAEKSNKNEDKLLTSIPYSNKKQSDIDKKSSELYHPHRQNGLLWYMNLRQNSDEMKSETYLRVGPDINGLYTRIKKSACETVKASNNYREKSPEFQVIGVEKLALEIEAVNKVGFERLNIQLLNNQKCDEIITEHHK